MTSNCYIIDTSSLIALNRNNPMDVYPGVWHKMEYLIKSNRLFAPKEVLNETRKFDDSLFEWGKKQNKMFVEPTSKQIKIVKDILSKYPSLIKLDKIYAADPWVIALAIEMVSSPQTTLVEIKRIVVTEEKIRGNKIKIPFVCNDFGIEAIDILDMFRIEGWKF
jgi:rRNA maturation endonuclease Nob1